MAIELFLAVFWLSADAVWNGVSSAELVAVTVATFLTMLVEGAWVVVGSVEVDVVEVVVGVDEVDEVVEVVEVVDVVLVVFVVLSGLVMLRPSVVDVVLVVVIESAGPVVDVVEVVDVVPVVVSPIPAPIIGAMGAGSAVGSARFLSMRW